MEHADSADLQMIKLTEIGKPAIAMEQSGKCWFTYDKGY